MINACSLARLGWEQEQTCQAKVKSYFWKMWKKKILSWGLIGKVLRSVTKNQKNKWFGWAVRNGRWSQISAVVNGNKNLSENAGGYLNLLAPWHLWSLQTVFVQAPPGQMWAQWPLQVLPFFISQAQEKRSQCGAGWVSSASALHLELCSVLVGYGQSELCSAQDVLHRCSCPSHTACRTYVKVLGRRYASQENVWAPRRLNEKHF